MEKVRRQGILTRVLKNAISSVRDVINGIATGDADTAKVKKSKDTEEAEISAVLEEKSAENLAAEIGKRLRVEQTPVVPTVEVPEIENNIDAKEPERDDDELTK